MNAVISEDGVYRYWLERWFDEEPFKGHHPLVFCMLNPSTADAEKDDPTIRRCLDFARREKANGIVVINVYAYRATDPKKLWKAKDPFGPENQRNILDAASIGHVICAWGKNANPADVELVTTLFHQRNAHLLCLGTNKDGSPKHPLYIKKTQPLIPWGPR